MNYLIETPVGTLLSAAAGKKIANFKRQMKKLEALNNELCAEILMEMEQRGIVKAQSKDVIISYIEPTTRESFDTKAFRKDHADLYDEYTKLTPVKASVRIKVLDEEPS